MFEEFYGLTGRPFQLTPDPDFYFESATHRKALSYLGYGLAQGEGFVVITGEVGAGKTTLVGHLMATIDPECLTVAQVVTSRLGAEEMIHVVAQAFGLEISGHDKASALGAIEAFLHEEARAGRRCLLIVDESQNLSIEALEELRMLSNFQLGSHPLLQTLLLGQPEFRQTLAHHSDLEQLRQRVIATHHLEAMEEKEVRDYIEHRLKCVGWKNNPSFDQDVFLEIYVATGGVPRRINQVVNRLLLLGAVERRETIDRAMLAQVLSELSADVEPERSETARISEPVAQVPQATGDGQQVATVTLAEIEGVLVERDRRIDELQELLTQLSASVENGGSADQAGSEQIASLADRTASLEGRLIDQDRHSEDRIATLEERVGSIESRLTEHEMTLRHTLTMLIEWIETGDGGRIAA